MKYIKSILSLLIAIAITVSVSSCRKNKNNDGDNDGTIKKYVPTQINLRESGMTTEVTWFYNYNSKRQITQMRKERGSNLQTYDLIYLDNGNLDYYTYQSSSSPLSTTNFKYDGGLRLIEMSYNGTPEVNFSHSVSSNIYTANFIGSSSSIDMDFDTNDNLQGLYSGLDSFVISYLPNQQGVFTNVALKPSVVIPFHLFASTEFYFLHPNQITELKTPSSGAYLYTDQQRDDNGNLTSFRMGNTTESLIYTIEYELK